MDESGGRWWSWWKVLVTIAAAFLLIVAAIVVPIVRGLYSPPLGDLPVRADAVVVFGGEDIRTSLALRLMENEFAPVLVVSFGYQDTYAQDLCEQQEPFEVMCVVPADPSTRGEARMFGELADEYGWDSVVGVTGNYHVQRARTYMNRCFDGTLAFVAVEWSSFSRRLLRHETLGNIQARYLSRGC